MRHLRKFFPLNEFDITLKSCVLRIDDMRSSVVHSGNVNGFKTASGQDVVRKNPPRHNGGKLFSNLTTVIIAHPNL